MEIRIIYEHEEMRDMVVHVNNEGLQKIMQILTDESNIIVTQITPHTVDWVYYLGTRDEKKCEE